LKYSLDTSAFIVPYRNWIPPDLVPKLWNLKDELIQSGEIKASREVYREIIQTDDDLSKWVKERRGMFIDVDEVQQRHVDNMVNRFPKWVDYDAQRNVADPFVIALAMEYELIVVSYEKGGSEEKPSIPYVCREYGVEHLLYTDFLRQIGYSG
jgi:hypothetical protein